MNDSVDSDVLTALFVRLAGGDRSALPPAFQIIYPLARRFCEKMLGRGADADDATQACLERVFEQIGSFDSSRHALPWVLTIAAWEVRTIRRRAWRARQKSALTSVEELTGAAQDPEAAAISKELLAVLDELVELLPDTDRRTLRQVLERELQSEVAVPTDSTFRKRKERALAKLRALLRNLGHVQ
ncbi:MAG TPA: sigma-70 family RNA polymerase sigma factor [Polyangiaceae bacterium]